MFSAFFFERTFDVLSETIFESANKGVSTSIYLLCKANSLSLSIIFSETVEGYQA